MISLTRQVNKFLSLNKWSSSIRFTHDDKKTIYPLKSRSLVKVSGPEASLFLQGLITNDMNHFEDGAHSIYAMFLSNKGRVLYDTLVHKWRTENNDEFMLECDKSIQQTLQKYLKRFKLKRKLKIEDVSEAFKIWALIAPSDFDNDWEPNINLNINVYKDPRLAELGYRLITTAEVGQIEIQKAVGRDTVVESDDEEYVALRYRLGVSEGSKDLVPGTNFPLEANCDYLHGVSFHKGCYIGQELTARVHHTGVVRKRIMPIQILDIKNEDDLQSDATIWSGTTNLGKFKGHVGTSGLGLVRIKEALQAKIINIGRNNIEIIRPHWWPLEAPKEKLTALKSEKDTKDN